MGRVELGREKVAFNKGLDSIEGTGDEREVCE